MPKWKVISQRSTNVTCAIAFDAIRRAMVNYDPRKRYSRDSIAPDGSVVDTDPDISPDIMLHIKNCRLCNGIMKDLEGKKLAEGMLFIKLTGLRPKDSRIAPCFSGTPEQILDAMIAFDFGPSSPETIAFDRLEFMEQIMKMADSNMNPEKIYIMDAKQFIGECSRRRLIEIVLDPWFVIQEMPKELQP
jgi:hypothetical protein